jgi:hypothetical protein
MLPAPPCAGCRAALSSLVWQRVDAGDDVTGVDEAGAEPPVDVDGEVGEGDAGSLELVVAVLSLLQALSPRQTNAATSSPLTTVPV